MKFVLKYSIDNNLSLIQALSIMMAEFSICLYFLYIYTKLQSLLGVVLCYVQDCLLVSFIVILA